MANTVHPSKRIDKEIEITKQRNERDSAIKKMNEERKKKKKKKCIYIGSYA